MGADAAVELVQSVDEGLLKDAHRLQHLLVEMEEVVAVAAAMVQEVVRVKETALVIYQPEFPRCCRFTKVANVVLNYLW